MKKHLLAAVAAVALSIPLSAGVLAQQAQAEHHHHQFSPEDRAAFADAKIAALKAGLKLSPAQEKNWPAVETALRDIAKARAARFAENKDKWKDIHEHRSVIEGLQLHSKALSAKAAETQKLAEAAKPLFDSLDDTQKRRFAILLHAIAKGPHHHGHEGEHEGHGRD
jgi:hypothetical protein